MNKAEIAQQIEKLQKIIFNPGTSDDNVIEIEQQLNSLQSADDKTTVLLELLSSQGYKDWLNTNANSDLNEFIICQYRYYQATSDQTLLSATIQKLKAFIIKGLEWYTPKYFENKLGFKFDLKQFPSHEEEQTIQQTIITIDKDGGCKQADDILNLIMQNNVGRKSNSNDLHLYLHEARFNLKHRGLHIRALKRCLMYAVVKLFDDQVRIVL
jgi:hypothetical protein